MRQSNKQTIALNQPIGYIQSMQYKRQLIGHHVMEAKIIPKKDLGMITNRRKLWSKGSSFKKRKPLYINFIILKIIFACFAWYF